MEEAHEKNQPLQFAKWVLNVLYSPRKTFEEIVKKPDVKGVLLILLITLPITVGGQYISGTKLFLETSAPENDFWTEKSITPASFLWSPNDSIAFDNHDHVSGNYSVSTFISESLVVSMRLTNIGSFNCSEEKYSRLSFRIKWLNNANVTPTDALVQLFSLKDESRKFELNIKSLVANSSNIWSNITVSLSSDNWVAVQGNPVWTNITGIDFKLTWSNPANLTLKVDGIYFGKYETLNSVRDMSLFIVNALLNGIVDFLLKWLLLAGFLYLILKSFSAWKDSWKNEIFAIGYVYSTLLVYLLVNALLLLSLPPLFIPYNVWHPLIGEETRAQELLFGIYDSGWGGQLSYNLFLPWNFIFYFWATILCMIALKKMVELSWTKAFLMAFGSFILSMLFRAFIPI